MTNHPFCCHIAVTPSFLHHHSTPSSKICCHTTITLLSHYCHTTITEAISSPKINFFPQRISAFPRKSPIFSRKSPTFSRGCPTFSRKSPLFPRKSGTYEESAHPGCAALWQMWQKKTQNSWYIRAHARERIRTPSASTASPNLLPHPSELNPQKHSSTKKHSSTMKQPTKNQQWNNQR